ncbi:MAG: tRNA (adenosine(37)-N6)-threonylcarbamoyltransferase complex ATPase subunit type 1 TsaE [Clostridia bacterium]|nr:tRNA (adenosine(37)-N6)-threonylcarbamoyltransferase complex ATPase subunit type 1 TsaE [Clostridia bacterium]
MEKFITNSEAETISLGETIGKTLKSGSIIALYGDLGCGKTAFTKGVAKALGINEITSPTFTLVNEHLNGLLPLYHFDAYRIDAQGWLDSGFDEYLFDDGVCIIEWSENIESILPENTIKVNISRDLKISDTTRIIEISR